MPKAAIHKHHNPMLCQNKVRFAGKSPGMDAIPVTECEQTTPDQEFGLRVLTPDTGHHPAAYGGGNNVSH